MKKIFVINVGSTSTKIALFEDMEKRYERNVEHQAEELKKMASLTEQLPFRKRAVEQALAEDCVSLQGLTAVAARGGTFGLAEGGAYLVEEKLLEACRHPVTDHPSNLSAILGHEIAEQYGCRAYIYDAVCTCEVTDMARMTGLKDVKRRPFSHVLNTRAAARKLAEQQGRRYEDMNFIVAHLGGGISINVHDHGKIVDLVCDDDGPMSPERAGRLNTLAVIKLCFAEGAGKEEIIRRVKGRSGLLEHLGSSDLREAERRKESGDEQAAFLLETMAYQISKFIAELAPVVNGQVDAIILTGGAANSRTLTEGIIRRVAFLAPVTVMPGAMEMEALAGGIGRVLDGQEEAKIYKGGRT